MAIDATYPHQPRQTSIEEGCHAADTIHVKCQTTHRVHQQGHLLNTHVARHCGKAYQHGNTANKELILLGEAEGVAGAQVPLRVRQRVHCLLCGAARPLLDILLVVVVKGGTKGVQRCCKVERLQAITSPLRLLSLSKVGLKGFRAVAKLNACRTSKHIGNQAKKRRLYCGVDRSHTAITRGAPTARAHW